MKAGIIQYREDCIRCGKPATHFINRIFQNLKYCKKCWLERLKQLYGYDI